VARGCRRNEKTWVVSGTRTLHQRGDGTKREGTTIGEKGVHVIQEQGARQKEELEAREKLLQLEARACIEHKGRGKKKKTSKKVMVQWLKKNQARRSNP